MIDYGLADKAGRRVTLRPVDDKNWRAVADVVPLDNQRGFVPPSAARYLLLSLREGVWQSLAVYADDEVVGHLMLGWHDDDRTYWVGGMLIDAAQQSKGLGRTGVLSLVHWLIRRPDCQPSASPSTTRTRWPGASTRPSASLSWSWMRTERSSPNSPGTGPRFPLVPRTARLEAQERDL